LETSNKRVIAVDLRKNTMIPLPQFIQNDTNIIEFIIKDNGADADLTTIGRIVVNYKRPDNAVVSRLLEVVDGKVPYKIGLDEMKLSGRGKLEIQFFSLDNVTRLSTKIMEIQILDEIGSTEVREDNDQVTLLQELFIETDEAKKQTEIATNNANTAASNADAKAALAEQVATENKTRFLDAVETIEERDVTYPNPIHGDTVRVSSTTYRYEEGRGWVAFDKFYPTALDEVNEQLAQMNQQLSDSERQEQPLNYGLNVLDGKVGSPARFQMEGRTLTSLATSLLSNNKYYVLADKLTKIILGGTTYAGVARLNPTALTSDERPILSRIATFEGKKSGSNVENPHTMKSANDLTLRTPSQFAYEHPTTGEGSYEQLKKLDGAVLGSGYGTTNEQIAQQLFSFNIVEEVERKLGKIPKSPLADKVQWCKDNVAKLTVNWYGYGSSPTGNKATFRLWDGSVWTSGTSHYGNSVAKLTLNTVYLSVVDTNGNIHWLANASASDGITASTINTDYIELEIELKPNAQLWHPLVPLYEVSNEEYNKILVDWNVSDVLSCYPVVQGSRSITHPFVMAEGANLAPTHSIEWEQGSLGTANGAEASGTNRLRTTFIEVVKGEKYNFSVSDGYYNIAFLYDNNKNYITYIDVSGSVIINNPNVKYVRLWVRRDDNADLTIDEVPQIQPMLNLGSEPRLFVPRNPSYKYWMTTLGSIGDKKDLLYEKDGKDYVEQWIEKDVVLDGSLAWQYHSRSDEVGITSVKAPLTRKALYFTNRNSVLTKFDGTPLTQKLNAGVLEHPDWYYCGDVTGSIDGDEVMIAISDADATGYDLTTTQGIKDYFNANPYKLSYVLAKPVTEEVRSEGSIVVNGLTQIEVGSGVVVREKISNSQLKLVNGYYNLNYGADTPSWNYTWLKNKVAKFIGFYESTNDFTKSWNIYTGSQDTIRGHRASIKETDIDMEKDHYVTYLVLDRHLFASNPVDVLATYAKSVGAALNDMAVEMGDIATDVSVLGGTVYDMLVRLKKLEQEGAV
jgi:hypothetical protein